MNRHTISEQRYFNVLRFGTFGVSSFLWLLSILWSADGFGITVEGWKLAGYGLGICVTIVQLVFNRGTMNPTLYFGGLAAYLYGISTNIIGLISITGRDFTEWDTDPVNTLFALLLISALAVIVEVLPESLLLWAINPEQGSPGDFISSLFGGSGLNTENRPQKRPNKSNFREISSALGQNMMPNVSIGQNKVQNVSMEQRETFRETKQTKPYPYRVNWRENVQNGTNIHKVLTFHRDYWGKTGRECPNKVLVRGTGVSKGQVSSVISKLKSGGFA